MKNFLLLVLFALLFAAVCQAQSSPFQLVSVSSTKVKIKIVSETKLYNVALVAGSQTYEGSALSVSKNFVRLSNGSTFIEGSSGLPFPMQLQLSPSTEITISGFAASKGFKATKVMFLTEKNAKPLYLDIP